MKINNEKKSNENPASWFRCMLCMLLLLGGVLACAMFVIINAHVSALLIKNRR
jgi:cell division protein FtsL